MNKDNWKDKIQQACQTAGTYGEYFDGVIDQLAQIMETRDEALAQYRADGSRPVVEYTNKGGATNQVEHPALSIVHKCNSQALSFWKELGLTPIGFQKIHKDEEPEQKFKGLEEVLQSLKL